MPMSAAKPSVLCLMGPTASGKSDLAIRLGESLPVDVINVDATLVYKGLDIGSGKPSMAERKGVPHFLIDVCDPTEHFCAAQFVKEANQQIHASLAANRMPVLCGGTMMYFNVLQKGLSPLPPQDPQVRSAIDEEAKAVGWAQLHAALATVDPEAAKVIRPQDVTRIQRALEVYRTSGKPISQWWALPKPAPEFKFVNVAILPDERLELHNRIASRLTKMLEAGFINEVQQLLAQPEITGSESALRSVGYRQVVAYLKEGGSPSELHDKILFATRQLAKRQLTWLRHQFDITPISMTNPESLIPLVPELIQLPG